MKKILILLMLIPFYCNAAEQLIYCQDKEVEEAVSKLANELEINKDPYKTIKVYAGWASDFDEKTNILSCRAIKQIIDKKTETIEKTYIYYKVHQISKFEFKITLVKNN